MRTRTAPTVATTPTESRDMTESKKEDATPRPTRDENERRIVFKGLESTLARLTLAEKRRNDAKAALGTAEAELGGLRGEYDVLRNRLDQLLPPAMPTRDELLAVAKDALS